MQGHTFPQIQECLNKGVGLRSLVSGLQTPGWWPNLAVGQRESDLRVVELLGVRTLAKRHWDSGGLDDLDARGSYPMTRSHLIVHLLDGSVKCQIAVLLVHVVVAGSALIPHPDTIVLDGGWVLLKNLTEIRILSN